MSPSSASMDGLPLPVSLRCTSVHAQAVSPDPITVESSQPLHLRRWDKLPSDCLATVASLSTQESIASMRLVCKHWASTPTECTRATFSPREQPTPRPSSSPANARYSQDEPGKPPSSICLPGACKAAPVRAEALVSLPLHVNFSRIRVLQMEGVLVRACDLDVVCSCENLTALSLARSHLEGNVLSSIANAAGLAHVSFAGAHFTHPETFRNLRAAPLPLLTATAPQTPPRTSPSGPPNVTPVATQSGHKHHRSPRSSPVGGSKFARPAQPLNAPTLHSLDISNTSVRPDDLAAVLRSQQSLCALRVSTGGATDTALAAATDLPQLQHLDLGTLRTHDAPAPALSPRSPSTPQPPLFSSLEAICAAVLARGAAPPTPSALWRVARDAPWWRDTESGPILLPSATLHIVIDLPLLLPAISRGEGCWLHDSWANIPGRGLSLRFSPADTAAAAADGDGPTLREMVCPPSTRLVHLLLGDIVHTPAPLLHLQLLGVDVTDALVRHLAGRRVPLDTLRLLQQSQPFSMVQTPPRSAAAGTLGAGVAGAEEHAPSVVLSSCWRRVSPPVWRQLIDAQAPSGLRVLSLCHFDGVDDTVIRRVRAVCTHLEVLELSRCRSITPGGLAPLRSMALRRLCLSGMGPSVPLKGLEMLSSTSSPLSRSLCELTFDDNAPTPPAQLWHLPYFPSLRYLSLVGSCSSCSSCSHPSTPLPCCVSPTRSTPSTPSGLSTAFSEDMDQESPIVGGQRGRWDVSLDEEAVTVAMLRALEGLRPPPEGEVDVVEAAEGAKFLSNLEQLVVSRGDAFGLEAAAVLAKARPGACRVTFA